MMLSSVYKVSHRGYLGLRSLSSLVVCGDCRDVNSYSKLGLGPSNGALADVLITDPPYCLLHRRRKGGDLRDPKKIAKKVDNQITVPRFDDIAAYRSFTQEWLPLCIKEALKPAAPLIIWTNALGKETIINACKTLGYQVRGEFIWAKTTSNKDSDFDLLSSTKSEVLLRVYETALVFQHSSVSPQTEADKKAQFLRDAALPWSVVSGYHEDNNSTDHQHTARRVISEHPCHKPLRAMLPLVSVWSKPGQTVLDPFVGSGGVVSAVLRAGEQRSVKGMEVVEEWAAYSNRLLLQQQQ